MTFLRRITLLLLAMSLPAGAVPAQEEDLAGLELEELLAAELVPRDVLGGHIHARGEWMIGLRLGWMDMAGNRDGARRLSVEEVHASHPVAPTRMDMEMLMAEVMYGLTDRVTLMAMVSQQRISMDHVTRNGREFTTRSDGIGDVLVMVHADLAHGERHWWIGALGLSLPTGSIEVRDATPAGPDRLLPYPMRLGSGSHELFARLDHLRRAGQWLLLFRGAGRFALERNDRDYAVGDRFQLEAELSRSLSPTVAATGGARAYRWNNYRGADPDLNPALVPTADPQLRGGSRVDLVAGLRLLLGQGTTSRHELSLEYAVPIDQSLDGPQLELDQAVRLGWRWSF